MCKLEWKLNTNQLEIAQNEIWTPRRFPAIRYSFIMQKWAYNSFQVAHYSSIIPSFYIPQVQNRPQNSEIETSPLHAQR